MTSLPAHETPIRRRSPGLIAARTHTARHPEPAQAAGQAGAFTEAQARQSGHSRRSVNRLIATGVWVRVVGRVLRHVETDTTPWLLAHATYLAGSRSRVVSHSTAAALWGWAVEDAELFHVLRGDGLLDAGVRQHRFPCDSNDVVHVEGIRITGRHRTVADLLCWGAPQASVAWLSQGLREGTLLARDLRAVRSRLKRRTGSPRAREVLVSCRGLPFSVLEWEFHQLAWEVGGDHWSFNTPIRDTMGVIGWVDAVHGPGRLVVELDGRAFHGAERFQADRSRDQRLVAAGYRVLRFTWEDLTQRRAWVREALRTSLAGR